MVTSKIWSAPRHSLGTIVHILQSFKPGKAAGPDNIPQNLCRASGPSITSDIHPVTKLRHLPSDWLTANIIPEFKKGNISTPANYRPISLTTVCCKVMKHIIFHCITNHLNTHNISFRPGFSCNTQLMFFVDDILKAMDSRYPVDLVLLDFSKAFDTVAHKKLLLKLANFGIQSNIHKWITTWLTSRTQRVLVEGCTSSTKKVLSGVPQFLDP